MADGTSLIPAVSQGIPVVYGATIYGRDPNVVFSLAETGIDSRRRPRRQVDRHPGPLRLLVGGPAGAARVARASTPEDVEIVTYPDFGQSVAVAQGQVDAATGFVTNEPVQLRLQGLDVNVLRVDDVAPLAGSRPGRRPRHARAQG